MELQVWKMIKTNNARVFHPCVKYSKALNVSCKDIKGYDIFANTCGITFFCQHCWNTKDTRSIAHIIYLFIFLQIT